MEIKNLLNSRRVKMKNKLIDGKIKLKELMGTKEYEWLLLKLGFKSFDMNEKTSFDITFRKKINILDKRTIKSSLDKPDKRNITINTIITDIELDDVFVIDEKTYTITNILAERLDEYE